MITINNSNNLSSAKRVQNSNKSIAVFKKNTDNLSITAVYDIRTCIQSNVFHPILLCIKLESLTVDTMSELVEYETGKPLSKNKQYVVSPCLELLEAIKEEGYDVNTMDQVEIDTSWVSSELLASLFASCPILQFFSDESIANGAINSQGVFDIKLCNFPGIAYATWHIQTIQESHSMPAYLDSFVNTVADQLSMPADFKDFANQVPDQLSMPADFKDFSNRIMEDCWRFILKMLTFAKESSQGYPVQDLRQTIETHNKFAERWGTNLCDLVRAYHRQLTDILCGAPSYRRKNILFDYWFRFL